MAYDKEKILADALDIIEKQGVRKVTELTAYLPISRETFYAWEFHKSDKILTKIEDCKIARKAKMRKKWIDSDVPALQIAAYKLEADDDEMETLTMSKVKQETTISTLPTIKIDFGTDYQGNEGGA